MPDETLPGAEEVLGFWFTRPGDPEHGRPRDLWWRKDPTFDADVRARFLALHEAAAAGACDHWQATARGTLALTIVLDQFPRNMFRGSPRAFATDAEALAVAEAAIGRGFDRALPPVERKFFYLPFEHAENLAVQERAVALFAALPASPTHDKDLAVVRRHREIIARFARFPHRNSALGRVSTAEETVFLTEPCSSF